MKNFKKKILFRVDAGGEIGLGHFYRSVNLVGLLIKRGHEVTIIHLPSDFWSLIPETDLLHLSLTSDDCEEEMLKIFYMLKPDIFYVDGIISFTEFFIEQIKKTSKVVFYQNLSDSKHLCDVFILPSIHQNEVFFKSFKKFNTLIFKGLEYFTFNSRISQIEQKKISLDNKVRQIAVMAGGSDPANILLRFYNMVKISRLLEVFSFTFFYGTDYLFKDSIPREPERNVSFCLFDAENILKNDMLVATFGVSAYEFMYLGVPVLGIGHQESNTKALEVLAKKTGGIYNLGLIDNLSSELLNETFDYLIRNPHLLKEQVINAWACLDLMGIERVTTILEDL